MRSVAILLLAALPLRAAPPVRVADFELRDARGNLHRLIDREAKATVVVFLGLDCPLANLYAPRLGELHREFGPRGVRFVSVNSNRHDDLAGLLRFSKEHRLPFAYLKDAGGKVADAFKAERTPEAFVIDREGMVQYRGRIDDQYEPGLQKPKVGRRDLAEALVETLAGKPVSVPATTATGCRISRGAGGGNASAFNYRRDIEPIIHAHCQGCHRPGQIAPFSLTSYKDVCDWSATIAEVVTAGRMPPWHADPKHGKFSNDPSLSADEKRKLLAWIDADCPEGDPADDGDGPPPRRFTDGWAMPQPDKVFALPEPFAVPAEGVVEYQLIEVDPGFKEEVWVTAAEIRPGNRRVVHHCSVFLRPPGAKGEEVAEAGRLGSFCLAAYAVGTPPMILPEGMAKRIPAGWKFLFVLHYTPVGTPQSDRTEIGLKLVPADQVRKEVATKLLYDEFISIPPHAANHRVWKSWKLDKDMLLLALFPHMHLRGKSFLYEAEYPDGTKETLLSVPAYDFNWQHRYVLAEPKRIPAGTTLVCTAIYDNSAANPANPDPNATVLTGKQSWDEMFNGYFEVALADEDLIEEEAARRIALEWRAAALTGLIVAPIMLWWARRRRAKWAAA